MTMSTIDDDPYTMEMRLCDDEGMVSEATLVDPPGSPVTVDLTYMGRFKRLRALGGKPWDGEPFHCTGSAHIIPGEHIRCTSLAHQRSSVTFDVAGAPSLTFEAPIVGYRTPDGKVYAPEDVQVIRAIPPTVDVSSRPASSFPSTVTLTRGPGGCGWAPILPPNTAGA
jgi:hypothetical protein